MDSPIWDVEDCAPVYPVDYVIRVGSPAHLLARLERYQSTCDILDVIIDGVIVDFAQLVRDAIAEEEKSYGRADERTADGA